MEMNNCRDSSELGLFKVVVQKSSKRHVRAKSGLFIIGLLLFIVVLLLTLFLTGEIEEDSEYQSTGPPKLLQIPVLSENNAQTSHPKPFKVDFLGPQPRKFTPTTPSTTPTTKKATTLVYPQLTNFRNRYYPKNIQEILKHVTTYPPIPQIPRYVRNNEKRHTSNPEDHTTNPVNADLFQRFVPKDPSEVNLLATAMVRFSPPVWKDFRNIERHQYSPHLPFVPKVTHISNQAPNTIPLNSSFAQNIPTLLTNENQATNENEMTKIIQQFVHFRENAKKAMTITLKLYPMKSSDDTRNVPESVGSIFHQKELRSASNQMTINLKVFPEQTDFV